VRCDFCCKWNNPTDATSSICCSPKGDHIQPPETNVAASTYSQEKKMNPPPFCYWMDMVVDSSCHSSSTSIMQTISGWPALVSQMEYIIWKIRMGLSPTTIKSDIIPWLTWPATNRFPRWTKTRKPSVTGDGTPWIEPCCATLSSWRQRLLKERLTFKQQALPRAT